MAVMHAGEETAGGGSEIEDGHRFRGCGKILFLCPAVIGCLRLEKRRVDLFQKPRHLPRIFPGLLLCQNGGKIRLPRNPERRLRAAEQKREEKIQCAKCAAGKKDKYGGDYCGRPHRPFSEYPAAGRRGFISIR